MTKMATPKIITLRVSANMSSLDFPTMELTTDTILYEKAAHDQAWTQLSNDATTHDITFRAKTPNQPAAILVNAYTHDRAIPSTIHTDEYNIDTLEEFNGYFVLVIRLRDRKKPKKSVFGLGKKEKSSPGGILKTSIPVFICFAIPNYQQIPAFDLNLIKRCFPPTSCEPKSMAPDTLAKLNMVQDQMIKVAKKVLPAAQDQQNCWDLPGKRQKLRESLGTPEWEARWKVFSLSFQAIHIRQGIRQEWFMLKKWECELREESGMVAVKLGLESPSSEELEAEWLRDNTPAASVVDQSVVGGAVGGKW